MQTKMDRPSTTRPRRQDLSEERLAAGLPDGSPKCGVLTTSCAVAETVTPGNGGDSNTPPLAISDSALGNYLAGRFAHSKLNQRDMPSEGRACRRRTNS